MNVGDTIEFRARGPHAWDGKGTVFTFDDILTADGQTVRAIILMLVPGEAHNNAGLVATENQAILIGEGELV